jgi:hypothetical protein
MPSALSNFMSISAPDLVATSGREDLPIVDRVGLLRAALLQRPLIGLPVCSVTQEIHDLKLTVGWVRGVVELYDNAVARGETEARLARGARCHKQGSATKGRSNDVPDLRTEKCCAQSAVRSVDRVACLPVGVSRSIGKRYFRGSLLPRDHHCDLNSGCDRLCVWYSRRPAMPKKNAKQLERDIQTVLRRGKRSRHATKKHSPTITNRDQISDRTLRVLGDELDEAAARAIEAGAVGDLTYQGAGATGIVFCDERNVAYKVARHGREVSVFEEAEWLMKAGQVPGVREHVARNARYDKKHDVLVRECVPGPSGTTRQTSKLFDLHQGIRTSMAPYGWLSPEFKEDSYVMTRGRGPVLVDASSALRVGGELVRYAQDVLAARRPQTERLEDIAFALRHERGGSIPAAVADKLLAKLRARGVDT